MKFDTFIICVNCASVALNLYWTKINKERYTEVLENSKKLSGYQDDFIQTLTRFNKMITSLDIADGRTDSKSPRKS